jgi:hypothetical protein
MWLYCKIKTLRGLFATEPNPRGDYVIWPKFIVDAFEVLVLPYLALQWMKPY